VFPTRALEICFLFNCRFSAQSQTEVEFFKAVDFINLRDDPRAFARTWNLMEPVPSLSVRFGPGGGQPWTGSREGYLSKLSRGRLSGVTQKLRNPLSPYYVNRAGGEAMGTAVGHCRAC